MTAVGTLSSDLGPGKASMDLPPSHSNNVPLIVTSAVDDSKSDTLAASVDNDGSMSYMMSRSKLDMELNPFEQSFSGSATGSETVKTSKTVLPPIASISERLDPNSNQYGWNDQSLHIGPLSPSMLQGPQDPIVFEKHVSTSQSGVSLPISTVFSSGATVSESGFPFGMTASQPIPPQVGPVAEPYPQTMYGQQPNVSQLPASGPRQQQPQQQQQQQQQPYPQSNGQAQVDDRYISQQGAHHPDNANGYGNLHLLSQAQATHRDMWVKRESVDANGQVTQNQNRQQPQMPPGMVAAPQLPKNGVEPAFVRGVQRSRLTSEENSDDSSVLGQSNISEKSNKKRSATDDKMDEEEKRKNFLERNRQAALKCRQRKKQWLSNLQAKVEYLTTDNEHLQNQTAALRDEIIHLKALLLAHKDCPVAQANGVFAETIGLPNNHNGGGMLPHGRAPPNQMQVQAQAQAQQQQQQQRNIGQRGPLPVQMQTGGARVPLSSTGGPTGATVSNGGVGRSMPMSMMQDITSSTAAGQAQASLRY